MSKQIKVAVFIELTILAFLASIGIVFWYLVCDGAAATCFQKGSGTSELGFLLLATMRPIIFSPLFHTAYIAGNSFGAWEGTLLTALGAAFSSLALYFPGHLIGKKIVRPWLSANLPSTWRLLRSQDFKIIFILRWIPIFPFDITSVMCGIFDFHARRVFFFSLIGCLPEVFFFASMGEQKKELLAYGIKQLMVFGVVTTIPLLTYEFLMRKRGASLWKRVSRVYYELLYEARVNNEIVKHHRYSAEKIPVVLLYGFFSSRKTLSVMESLLTKQGFEVMSFNLGGSLGVFFTRNITETAEFIDRKIRRQMTRYGFKKVHIVAHSKGGLVALWWLLKLGGSQHCDKIITMGTPYKGTWHTYLAIFTPLAFFWKDVWQMRPGSSFLKDLHGSATTPGLKIYNLYSQKDSIASGKEGIFDHPGDVTAIPFHHLSHFQYLARRDVAKVIVKILRDEPLDDLSPTDTESLDTTDVSAESEIDSHKSAI